MRIQTFTNQVAASNTYVLSSNKQQILIDPGSDHLYLDLLTQPLAILLTHAHFDHFMGINAILARFPQVPIYLHPDEATWMTDSNLNASILLLRQAVTGPEATNFYQMGTNYQLGHSFTFQVRYTPGHSIGSVSLVFDQENFVITGDTLFKGGIGRTDLPTGDYTGLISSIKKQLFSLPEDMIVYPGHMGPTRIGQEIATNPFFNGFKN